MAGKAYSPIISGAEASRLSFAMNDAVRDRINAACCHYFPLASLGYEKRRVSILLSLSWAGNTCYSHALLLDFAGV